jgi:hypothetical protein
MNKLKKKKKKKKKRIPRRRNFRSFGNIARKSGERGNAGAITREPRASV